MAEPFTGTEVFIEDQVSGRMSKLCEPCKKKNKTTGADIYCRTCAQFQCSECEKVHEIFDFMSGHELVDVNQATAVAPKVDMKGLDICNIHDKEYEFYCVGHKELCCSKCVVTDHWECEKPNQISTEASKQNVKPRELTQKLTEAKVGANMVLEYAKETKIGNRKQIKEILEKVEDAIQFFSRLKKTINDKVNYVEESLLNELDIKQTASEDIMKFVDKYSDTLSTITAHGSDDQIFIAFNVIEKEFQPYMATLMEHQTDLYTLTFFRETKEVLTTLLQTGSRFETLNIDKVNVSHGTAQTITPVQLTTMTSLDVKKADGDMNEHNYTGLAFLPDGRLVVVDNRNCKLYVMNEKLEKLGMYTFKGHPHGVAVISDDQVAVTRGGGYKLLILHVSKSNTVTLSKTLKTTSRYDSICLMNDTTFVVGTTADKRPVRMMTITGEESDFPDIPDKEYKIDTSASTYIRDKCIVVLTDRYNPEIYLYDVKGKFTTRCVVKDENIKEPRGVCVGPNDCIFVCSMKTNSIVQLSLTGRLVSTYKKDMWCPSKVCVSQDGTKMAVFGGAIGELKLQLFHIK